jgi:hypothetical protein
VPAAAVKLRFTLRVRRKFGGDAQRTAAVGARSTPRPTPPVFGGQAQRFIPAAFWQKRQRAGKHGVVFACAAAQQHGVAPFRFISVISIAPRARVASGDYDGNHARKFTRISHNLHGFIIATKF